MITYSVNMISDNLKSVTQRIARCCEKIGRPESDVTLVCVTKEASIDQIGGLLGLGVKIIGENRVQDALDKYRIIGNKAIWHLIGHLQTNKVKDAVKIFSLIHSVDSLKLAAEIDKEAGRLGKKQDILIQVNTSGESSKFGIKPDYLVDFLEKTVLYPNINIMGLMTIAPEVDDPEKVRPYFRALKELQKRMNAMLDTQYPVQILSMGMSGDFEVAIEEGSTMVRIGRALFQSDR